MSDLQSEINDLLSIADPLGNKQLYANSPMSGSADEDRGVRGENSLHNAKVPNLVILHEKPEHRCVLLLKLRGMTNREISAETGYTEPWISQVCRQPWFQERLTNMLEAAGKDVIQNRFQNEMANNIDTLIELRDGAVSEQVRATCTIHLMDRFLGKPVAKTEVTGHMHHTSQKLADLDNELKLVEAETLRLTGAA